MYVRSCIWLVILISPLDKVPLYAHRKEEEVDGEQTLLEPEKKKKSGHEIVICYIDIPSFSPRQ